MKKIVLILSGLFLCGFYSFATSTSEKTLAEKSVAEKTLPEKAVVTKAVVTRANSAKSIENNIKFYGFVRNFATVDSREIYGGTLGLYNYMPKERLYNSNGQDLNNLNSWRLLGLTSRLGVNLSNYKVGNATLGGKIEADFYCMNKGGNVATFRLRQAYMSFKWWANGGNEDWRPSFTLYAGQKWHPMAADLPYVVSVESGVPFTPFARSPQLTLEYDFAPKFDFTFSMLYQMHYRSTGINNKGEINKKSNDYITYSNIPELYAGLTFKPTKEITMKAGVDFLSIRPNVLRKDENGVETKVSDRLSTISPMLFLGYNKGDFKFKAKTTYASAGEHLNMLTGYGVKSVENPTNWEYTPVKSSVSYISAKYGKKWQLWTLVGYMQNLGTKDDLALIPENAISGGKIIPENIYKTDNTIAKNQRIYMFNSSVTPKVNSLFRFEPALVYVNKGLTIGLDYTLTLAEMGEYGVNGISADGRAREDIHWLSSHRLQLMMKFAF